MISVKRSPREGAEIKEERDPSNKGNQSRLTMGCHSEVMRPAILNWILHLPNVGCKHHTLRRVSSLMVHLGIFPRSKQKKILGIQIAVFFTIARCKKDYNIIRHLIINFVREFT